MANAASPINPTKQTERIHSLDLLRGIALLGILIMNIQSFAMPGAAYLNPTAYGDLEGINRWVWTLSHIFADQKFMTLFSMLFGAGILLVSDRAVAKTGRSAGLHYARNAGLLVIGLIHAHLIWYGDILVGYALCGFFVYLFRNRKPRTMLIFGLLFFSVHPLLYALTDYSLAFMTPADLAEIKSGWAPSPELIREEIAAFTGSLSEQIRANSAAALEMETLVFMLLFVWRITGLMLIGMALYRWGVLSAGRSRAFYVRGMVFAFGAGFSLVLVGLMRNIEADFAMEYSMFTGSLWNYWGSLFVAFGYLCVVMLISKGGGFLQRTGIIRRLEAVGQMALTNYIMQSVIGVMIFFGIGFGLFGQVDRWVQILIVFGVWAVQLMWSKPWLERFQFGPLEWLWRSATYRSWQPMKRV